MDEGILQHRKHFSTIIGRIPQIVGRKQYWFCVEDFSCRENIVVYPAAIVRINGLGCVLMGKPITKEGYLAGVVK